MSTLRKRNHTAWLAAAIVLIIPLMVWSFSSNPPPGAPGENTCGGCHNGPGSGNVTVTSPTGATYTPGVTKRLVVTITDSSATSWGYEMTAVQAAATSTGAGTFTAADANSGTVTSGTKSYARQSNDQAGTTGSASFQVDWNPPASSVGNVGVYVAGVASGLTYTSSLTLTPAASGNPSLALSPSTLSFSYQLGGSTPVAQNVAVTSSGAALSFTAASSATWLTVTPTSGTTPGTLGVGINTTGLTAGNYTGTVTVTSTGAANSPQTVSVNLTVTSGGRGNPTLMLSPNTLSYTYQTGGTPPGKQNVAVTSSGTALSYTAASDQTWLAVTPASGSTPGALTVTVDPTGLAAGTYNGTLTVTSTGAANSPQTVKVTLTVTAPGSGRLVAYPRVLSFSTGGGESEDDSNRLRKILRISSRRARLHFTAEAMGGSWLSVSPSTGHTPGRVTVTVSPAGLAAGTYTGQINLSAPGAASLGVPVTFTVRSSGGGGGDLAISATTYTSDPSDTGAVSASWVYGAGVANVDETDPTNQGLVLSNNAIASSNARAGVILNNVTGITLNALGFDLRQGSLCSAKGPRFIVVTSDNVVHSVGGCSQANAQAAPATGWTRYQFNPSQATPAIAPDATVKSIALMLDDGPEAGGGMAVLDNINVNGTFIGHD
jgi:hypothetical protein